MIQADQRTLQALAQLAQQINAVWQGEGKALPANLDKFSLSVRKNPVTGATLTYRMKSAHEYQLCANFLADNQNMPGVNTTDFWLHPKGDHCFSFDASQPVPWVPNY